MIPTKCTVPSTFWLTGLPVIMDMITNIILPPSRAGSGSIFIMARFTLPRDLYHGKGSLEALKSFKGKKAIVCVGGGSMKKFGFLDKAVSYLKEAGMEVQLFEGIESDPSVETVMKGAQAMLDFQPDWIVAIGGGSPIDAAKAMWIKYEYPDITFEEMCKVFGIPELRRKAHARDRSVCVHGELRLYRSPCAACSQDDQGGPRRFL